MKKLSRIFLTVGILTILVLGLSIHVSASEEMQRIDVTVPELVEGAAFPAPVVDENANYYITNYTWKWTDGTTIRKAGDVVEVKRYRIEVKVEVKEGFEFADNAVIYVNGEPVQPHPNYYSTFALVYPTKAEFRASFSLRTKIDRAEVTVDVQPGGNVSETPIASMEPDKYTVLYRPQTYPHDYININTGYYDSGTYYELRISVAPNDQYEFAEGSVLVVNGQEYAYIRAAWDQIDFEYKVDLDKTVSTVDFPAFPETVAPGPGGRTDIETPEDAEYDLQQVWMDLRTGEIVDTLVAGDVYTLAYIATPKHGYFFREETTYTLGGEPCETMGDDQYRVIYKSYDLGATQIHRVDLTLPTLIKGCTPGTVRIPVDANYTLVEWFWAESTTGSFQDAQMVEALNFGTTAYAIPVLAAKNGYIFSEDVKLYFNGQEVAIEDIYAEGPILEIAGICGTLTPPTGTGWYREDNTWAYYENGTKAVSRWIRDSIDWCYVDASGLMVKNGWAKDSAGWCYLGSSGYMVRSKWILWEGDYYYLNANGYMLVNTWMRDSIDWCYLGPTGRMLTNAWQKDSKGWCYVGADGYMIRNGWAVDSVGICRLGGDGYMVYNQWVKDSDGWRYVGSNGYMVISNWALDGGYWYAFDEYGLMFSDAMVKYMDKYYYLDANGRMLTNAWFKVENNWSYAGADGAVPLKTWVKDSKGWCYIGGKGFMLKDTWITENGKKYYVDSNGYMLRNTTRTFSSFYERGTYYFDSNGVATYQSPF